MCKIFISSQNIFNTYLTLKPDVKQVSLILFLIFSSEFKQNEKVDRNIRKHSFYSVVHLLLPSEGQSCIQRV